MNLYAEHQDEDAGVDPRAETGWQTLLRYGREMVGDAMWLASPALYAIGLLGVLFWWLA
jgi:hypothetical protein